jgi:hypothetical protein
VGSDADARLRAGNAMTRLNIPLHVTLKSGMTGHRRQGKIARNGSSQQFNEAREQPEGARRAAPLRAAVQRDSPSARVSTATRRQRFWRAASMGRSATTGRLASACL